MILLSFPLAFFSFCSAFCSLCWVLLSFISAGKVSFLFLKILKMQWVVRQDAIHSIHQSLSFLFFCTLVNCLKSFRLKQILSQFLHFSQMSTNTDVDKSVTRIALPRGQFRMIHKYYTSVNYRMETQIANRIKRAARQVVAWKNQPQWLAGFLWSVYFHSQRRHREGFSRAAKKPAAKRLQHSPTNPASQEGQRKQSTFFGATAGFFPR